MIQHTISVAQSGMSLLPTVPILQLKDVYPYEFWLRAQKENVTTAEGQQRQLALPSKLGISKPQSVTQVEIETASYNNKGNLIN